jgi:hypothetical protein
MDDTCWNDGVAVTGCDGGVDAAARYPGEDLLCQMHASDLKKKSGLLKTSGVGQKIM